MPRQPRKMLDGGYYHLIARINNRSHVFKEDNDFEHFESLIAASKKKFSWDLYHYCLMSNHFHLLAKIGIGAELPKLMQFLLQAYSRYHKTKADYVGYLWQGRYKSLLIEKESYMLECGRYIERNPLRAMLVTRAEDYQWSSYRHYALGEKNFLVEDDPYFKDSSRNVLERQKMYHDFVRIENPYEKFVDHVLLQTNFDVNF